MKFKLKDAREVEVRLLRKDDDPLAFLKHINALVAEGAFLSMIRRNTLKQEIKWLAEMLAKQKKGKFFMLVCWHGKSIAGVCDVRKIDMQSEEGNTELGIAIAKPFRGFGLGELILKEAIALAKKKWRPRNIYLTVYSGNKPAIALYEKVGFRKVASLPNWVLNKGKYYDKWFMVLK